RPQQHARLSTRQLHRLSPLLRALLLRRHDRAAALLSPQAPAASVLAVPWRRAAVVRGARRTVSRRLASNAHRLLHSVRHGALHDDGGELGATRLRRPRRAAELL